MVTTQFNSISTVSRTFKIIYIYIYNMRRHLKWPLKNHKFKMLDKMTRAEKHFLTWNVFWILFRYFFFNNKTGAVYHFISIFKLNFKILEGHSWVVSHCDRPFVSHIKHNCFSMNFHLKFSAEHNIGRSVTYCPVMTQLFYVKYFTYKPLATARGKMGKLSWGMCFSELGALASSPLDEAYWATLFFVKRSPSLLLCNL